MGQIDFSLLPPLPQDAVALAASIEPGSGDHREHRGFDRHRISIPFPAVAVDEEFRMVGESFMAITRYISRGGLSFLSQTPVEQNHLIVELPLRDGRKSQLVLTVLWCEKVSPLFDIAGSFVTRIDE